MKIVRTKKLIDDLEKSQKEMFRKFVEKNRRKIRSVVKPVIIDALLESPEMHSLRNGQLKADFGLTFDPSYAIAWSVADSMKVRYTPVPNATMGFSIYIQPSKHTNLYQLDQAYQLTEDGVKLPWLQWLLEKGDSIIVADFGVLYRRGAGRSEMGVMVKNKAPFRVDSAYSGTEDDNFISRALVRNLPKIQKAAWSIFT